MHPTCRRPKQAAVHADDRRSHEPTLLL
jgi:hypothetical protein